MFMNGELGGMWKEVVMAYLRFQHFSGLTAETHDRWSLSEIQMGISQIQNKRL